MAYVILALVFLAAMIWGCIALLGPRAFIGLILLLVVGLAIYASVEGERDRKEQITKKIETAAEEKREAALQQELWSKVSPSQVELRDPGLTPPKYGDDYSLTASIKNLSNEQLSGFEIEVTASDCVPREKCEIVGQSLQRFWANIPPQQIRGITGRVPLYRMPQLRGKLATSFRVTRVYAGDFLDQWGVHDLK